MTPTTEAMVRAMYDRAAIEDVLVRYCHAVDRCDPELLLGVYWPGAIDDHVYWKGPAEDFVAYCMPFLRSRDQTTHKISNVLIRLDGEEAQVQSYVDAYERIRRADGTANDITISARYLDRMERRGDEWRIADRKVVIDWWRIWPDSFDWDRGIFGTRFTPGGRGEEDPSHALFGERTHEHWAMLRESIV